MSDQWNRELWFAISETPYKALKLTHIKIEAIWSEFFLWIPVYDWQIRYYSIYPNLSTHLTSCSVHQSLIINSIFDQMNILNNNRDVYNSLFTWFITCNFKIGTNRLVLCCTVSSSLATDAANNIIIIYYTFRVWSSLTMLSFTLPRICWLEPWSGRRFLLDFFR